MAFVEIIGLDLELEVGAAFQPTAPIPPLPGIDFIIEQEFFIPPIVDVRLVGEMGLDLAFYIQNASQSAKITALTQELTSENIVTLWSIDMTELGLGIARFTTEVTENGQPLRWAGIPYYPIPCQASGFDRKTDGPGARPTLSMSNVTKVMSSMIIEAKDLVGLEVTRLRTFRRFLDDGMEPSATDHWPIEVYVIDRKKTQNKLMVEFELASVLDQEGTKLPKRQVLRDYCSFVYRKWDEATMQWNIDRFDPCPYAGSEYFEVNGNKASDRAKDKCGKRLNDCKLRFGNYNPLPFRGFPGVSRVR